MSESGSLGDLLAERARLRRRGAELAAQGLLPARPEDDLALFRQLVEHSQGFMCVHDLAGTLLFVNSAAARALGFRPEDGVGWNLRRFLSPDVEHELNACRERIRTPGAASGLFAGRERGPVGGLVLASAHGATRQLGGYIAVGVEAGPGTACLPRFPAAGAGG